MIFASNWKSVICLFGLLAICSSAQAQIVVNGQGLIAVPPDKAQFAISVVTESVSPVIANNDNNIVKNVLRNSLINNGVSPQDIQRASNNFVAPITATMKHDVPFIAGFVVTNQYGNQSGNGSEQKFTFPLATPKIDKDKITFDFKPPVLEEKIIGTGQNTQGRQVQPKLGSIKVDNPVIVGYRCVNEYSVTLNDMKKLEEVCRACSRVPCCFHAMTLSHKEGMKIYEEAKIQAIKDAVGKAKSVASASGIKLGNIKKITESPRSNMPPYLDGMLQFKVEVTIEYSVE